MKKQRRKKNPRKSLNIRKRYGKKKVTLPEPQPEVPVQDNEGAGDVAENNIASSDHLRSNKKEGHEDTSSITGILCTPISTRTPDSVSLRFHDYTLSAPRTGPQPPDISILMDAKRQMDLFLKRDWLSIVEQDGVSCVLLSRARPRQLQRSVFCHYSGSVEINVHMKQVCEDSYLGQSPAVPLKAVSITEFVDRAVSIINRVRLMEVCPGVDREDCKIAWGHNSGGFIDKNPYAEARYIETFRSTSCSMLIPVNIRRCAECKKLIRPLRARALNMQKENLSKNLPNMYLTEEQKL